MNCESCDYRENHHKTKNTFNINAHFIAPNPTTSFNPKSVYPMIDSTAYIGPFSTIIGNVTIKKNVFISPNVSIRADEGFPIFIDSNTNIQDGVILHGLEHGRVENHDKEYSIYIGKHVSCAHGCLIHGPCKINDYVFVGFHATVLDAIIGEGCYVSINALITGNITVPPNRFIPVGAVIDTQEKADSLRLVSKSEIEFMREVQYVNNQFPEAYSRLFGSTKNSCSLTCDTCNPENCLNNRDE